MKIEGTIKELFADKAITLEEFTNGLKGFDIELSKVVSLHDGEYISVHKHNDELEKVKSELDALATVKKDYEKNVKELEKKLTGNEEALKTLEEYKVKNESISKEFADFKKDVEIKAIEGNKERIVKEALAKNGCTNDLILSALKGNGKYAGLEYKDGEVKGLSDLIESMKIDENTKSFFVVEKEHNSVPDFGNGGQGGQLTDIEKIRQNPQLAEKAIMEAYENRRANLKVSK